MNESHTSPSAGGQKRSGLWSDTKPPQTRPLHTSANQESRSEKTSEQTCESWGRKGDTADCHQTWTPWDRLEFGDQATGGKDGIQKHMYTQSEIPESPRARTITHCPPPPTQGRTSQRPKWVGQLRPRTTTRIPIPSSSDFTFLLVSFYFFSPLLFLPLCLLLFCLFFFLS